MKITTLVVMGVTLLDFIFLVLSFTGIVSSNITLNRICLILLAVGIIASSIMIHVCVVLYPNEPIWWILALEGTR